MFKSAKDIIVVARARGFTIRVDAGPPAMPVLECPRIAGGKNNPLVTDALLGALRAWRLEVIDEIQKEHRP